MTKLTFLRLDADNAVVRFAFLGFLLLQHDLNDESRLDDSAEQPLLVLLEPLGLSKLLCRDCVNVSVGFRRFEL